MLGIAHHLFEMDYKFGIEHFVAVARNSLTLLQRLRHFNALGLGVKIILMKKNRVGFFHRFQLPDDCLHRTRHSFDFLEEDCRIVDLSNSHMLGQALTLEFNYLLCKADLIVRGFETRF